MIEAVLSFYESRTSELKNLRKMLNCLKKVFLDVLSPQSETGKFLIFVITSDLDNFEKVLLKAIDYFSKVYSQSNPVVLKPRKY